MFFNGIGNYIDPVNPVQEPMALYGVLGLRKIANQVIPFGQSSDRPKGRAILLENKTFFVFVAIMIFISCALLSNAIGGKIRQPASTEETKRFDYFFQMYVAANRDKDIDTLMNVFGLAGLAKDNIKDSSVWHYSKYSLYKAIKTQETVDTKEINAWYIVSYDESSSRKLVLNIYGKYNVTTVKAYIFSWQVYPSKDNPQIFDNQEAAQKFIDEFTSSMIQVKIK